LRDVLPVYFGSNWGVDNADGRVRKEWTGVMGGTVDGLPFVGEVPAKKGLWISAGFNGDGMVLCLKSAEAMAAMLFGDPPTRYEWFPDSFKISSTRLKGGNWTARFATPTPEQLKKISRTLLERDSLSAVDSASIKS